MTGIAFRVFGTSAMGMDKLTLQTWRLYTEAWCPPQPAGTMPRFKGTQVSQVCKASLFVPIIYTSNVYGNCSCEPFGNLIIPFNNCLIELQFSYLSIIMDKAILVKVDKEQVLAYSENAPAMTHLPCICHSRFCYTDVIWRHDVILWRHDVILWRHIWEC